ncbi:chymotrypsinogen A [Octopus bimaculoides]|uniref:chymotrypsinogen A n=1 Tax=Octopus bimaculoides TaxID=37653 RepID=UPI0022E38DEC|nr:chymotrypsinogen A [Octopus bimaculoides]
MDPKYLLNLFICIINLMSIVQTEARSVCRYSYGCYICRTDSAKGGRCEIYRYCFRQRNRYNKVQCLRYNQRSTQDGCGIRPTRNIVGGSTSTEGKWPWQVSLQMKGSVHICGAVVINQNWLLTAAHCVYRTAAREFTAVFGEYDLGWKSGHEQYRSIFRTFVHPYFRPGGNYPNDVALAQLTSPIQYTDYVRSICLPSRYDSYDNDECWISGWGATRGTGSNRQLRELNVTLLNPNFCQNLWHGTIRPPLHICVNFGIKGACSGDSGGPLSCVRKSDGRFIVAGVTSWGDRSCQRYGFPSIYTNIKTFVPWIQNVIKANSRSPR